MDGKIPNGLRYPGQVHLKYFAHSLSVFLQCSHQDTGFCPQCEVSGGVVDGRSQGFEGYRGPSRTGPVIGHATSGPTFISVELCSSSTVLGWPGRWSSVIVGSIATIPSSVIIGSTSPVCWSSPGLLVHRSRHQSSLGLPVL